MRAALPALLAGAALVLPARAGDLRHFEDAALHAVQFLDAEEGFAVGDEGAVWHTIDGGKNWERQPTHVRASLRSLHFFNFHVGWVVGREELPQGGSAGVLLYTKDGGQTWHRLFGNTMPGLNQVRFVNATDGYLLGDGSDQFPTGLFRTSDSGRTWAPVKGPRGPGWLAGALQDGDTGALVGPWSRLAKLRHGALGTAQADTLGGRALRAVQVHANQAFAVGQGGAVLFSTTSGASWGYAKVGLPDDLLASLDFHDLAWVGNHLWAVGRPGSVLLHSANRGASWELVKTRQTLPLNGVFFLDERRGWAVGELGCILATTDGGRTWAVQHHGGQRAAVLLVQAGAAGTPVEAVAQLGGDDGYLTAGLRVAGPDPASAAPDRAADGQRFAAALRMAGGAAGEMLWQFPLPRHLENLSAEELLRAWNGLLGNRADQEMLRQLVLALRLWRPDVVLTDPPGAKAGSPAEALVAEALRVAFAQAADPRAFPEQIDRLGLEPWRVTKVYARWPARSGAEVALDLTKPSNALENTPRDFAAPAAELLARGPTAPPNQCYFHLLEARLDGAANHRTLMEGIPLGRGGTARREQEAVTELRPEQLKAIRDRRTFEMLTETPAGSLTDPSRTLAQIGSVLKGLPVDQAAGAAYALASRYAREGQWILAREAFLLMVERYPAHPRTADAYRWLIRHGASAEARRRQELGQFLMLTQAEYARKEDTTRDNPGAAQEVKGTRHLFLQKDELAARRWYEGSVEIARRLAAFGPLYAADPSVQFCVQAARRQLGQFDAAQKWYKQFQAQLGDGPWREAAAAEIWLANRSGPPPRPVAYCRQTGTRPYLDGLFDDACWHNTQPLVLRNAAGETQKDYPTEARLAYDRDFLYLALSCKHPADRFVAPVKVRKRDEDLRPFDRVSVLLDLDRDYSTCFQFQVDQRGCVCEDCWGDRTWNPRWFVAVHSDRTSWQIEAAIPLVELTGDPVAVGTAWAVNVVRTVPGRGVQAWSLPAGVEPRPEGLGLLLFAQDATAPPAVRPEPPPMMPRTP